MNLSERKVFEFMTCLRTNAECSEKEAGILFVSFKLEGLTETTIERLCHGSSTNNKDTHSKEIIAQTIAPMWKKSSRPWTHTNPPCCNYDLLVISTKNEPFSFLVTQRSPHSLAPVMIRPEIFAQSLFSYWLKLFLSAGRRCYDGTRGIFGALEFDQNYVGIFSPSSFIVSCPLRC